MLPIFCIAQTVLVTVYSEWIYICVACMGVSIIVPDGCNYFILLLLSWYQPVVDFTVYPDGCVYMLPKCIFHFSAGISLLVIICLSRLDATIILISFSGIGHESGIVYYPESS